jgi:hypothetical protein
LGLTSRKEFVVGDVPAFFHALKCCKTAKPSSVSQVSIIFSHASMAKEEHQ